jgi:Glycosyl hydrolase family 26
MSSHQRQSRRAYRLWLAVNGLVLVVIAGWILKPSLSGVEADRTAASALVGPTTIPTGVDATGRPFVPLASGLTRADVLAMKGIRYGLCTPRSPYSKSQLATIAGQAGTSPSMLQFFVKWTQAFPPAAITDSYEQGALPVLSWEPWAGPDDGLSQPAYKLSRIYGGAFDKYITAFATAARNMEAPIAIRFAHEMNGAWYPWSERQSGNRPGDYVKAWRHVHDIFAAVGATNVIWIWSPNILRPVPHVSLAALYPGDAYVDWVGLVGYAVHEHTAAAVYQPSITAIGKFTHKPIVITETGAQPSAFKAAWITDFFHWLAAEPRVIGFIWFEYSKTQGGNEDWRFTATPATLRAFHDGLETVHLAPVLAGT